MTSGRLERGREGGVWRVGTTRDRLRLLSHSAATDDSQHPRRSDPDSRRFVSFTLFSLLLEGQFCFVFLQCHRLPCSSFNFLIEDCIYRCPFFVLFFLNCDQFWLNVITAVFPKRKEKKQVPVHNTSCFT